MIRASCGGCESGERAVTATSFVCPPTFRVKVVVGMSALMPWYGPLATASPPSLSACWSSAWIPPSSSFAVRNGTERETFPTGSGAIAYGSRKTTVPSP
jgi:hypothetical protein